MPSNLKDETADVRGNASVVSAADFNKHDDEIRAIEKSIGVLPLDADSPPADPCSLAGALSALATSLQALRDDLVETASGAVAVMDPAAGADGMIPFPAAWSTTLVSDLDDGLTLAPIDVTVADVSGMPPEGYVTIVNDMSTAMTDASYSGTLGIVSPLTAYAAVGKEFSYKILTSSTARIEVSTVRPSWMTVSGNMLGGSPGAADEGTSQVNITLTSTIGTQAIFSLSLIVLGSTLPGISTDAFATHDTWGYYLTPTATEGEPYSLSLSSTPSNLPVKSWQIQWVDPQMQGISMLGHAICGTPQWLGPPPALPWTTAIRITITVTDIFDRTGSQNFWLTVQSHAR